MDQERAESGLGDVEREAAAEQTASPPSDTPVGSVQGKRQWVMIAGGVMALGWLVLLISLLIGSGAVAMYALVVMILLSIWWGRKTRVPTEPSESIPLDSWLALIGHRRAQEDDGPPRRRFGSLDPDEPVARHMFAQRRNPTNLGDAIQGGRRLKPIRRAIFRTTFAVIKGFFTPVIAAVAEWRSAQ